jgi:hypothetical protein
MSTTILVRQAEPSGDGFESHNEGRHLADPQTGEPVLGEFANQYREFATRAEAVQYVERHGYVAVLA